MTRQRFDCRSTTAARTCCSLCRKQRLAKADSTHAAQQGLGQAAGFDRGTPSRGIVQRHPRPRIRLALSPPETRRDRGRQRPFATSSSRNGTLSMTSLPSKIVNRPSSLGGLGRHSRPAAVPPQGSSTTPRRATSDDTGRKRKGEEEEGRRPIMRVIGRLPFYSSLSFPSFHGREIRTASWLSGALS